MYQPKLHRVEDLARQHDFMRAHPLGLLVTRGAESPAANPVPFLLDPGAGSLGVLRAHVARANPQWRELDGAREALVVFLDPGGYVTPSWYPSKREHGKVVPTWNYVCVQARGRPRAIHDRDWLRRQVDALTAEREAGRTNPWATADAPSDYMEEMLRALVGIEMAIESIEGKWKMSQNRSRADRSGVVAGLRSNGDAESLRLADIVEREARKAD